MLLASGQSTGSGAGVQEGHRCHTRHGPGLPCSLLSSGPMGTGEGPRQGTRLRALSCDPADSCGSLPRSHSLGQEERR